MNRKSATIDAGLALLPLRLFLGVTFVYAGVQKLSDQGFLHPGAPSYIGTQLHAFAGGTPGGFLLRWFALPFPALAGIGVALTEIAIGLLVTAGLLTRIAAGAGLSLNLVLFTTATWNTSPYFLGSDIVFVFAWLPFVLAGASRQPALDNLFSRPDARTRRGGVTVYEPAGIATMTRDVALRRAVAATGVATLAIGGLASLLRGGTASAGTRALSGAGSGMARHHRRTAAPSSRASTQDTTGGGSQSVPAGAVRIGSAGSLAPGGAATFNDPQTGATDIVVRHSDGSLSAMSAICTHAGCEVAYQGGVLYCPCHGSQFSAQNGSVLQGPASTPLLQVPVVERNGELYAT